MQNELFTGLFIKLPMKKASNLTPSLKIWHFICSLFPVKRLTKGIKMKTIFTSLFVLMSLSISNAQTEFDSSTSITSLKEEYGIKLDRNFSMVCTPNCFNEPDISKRGLNVFALDVLELASEIQLPRADSNQRPYLKYAYTYTCSFGNSSVKEILNDNYSIEGYLVNECNIEVTLQTIKSRLK